MHASLCDFLLDIFHNSVEAGASCVRVLLDEGASEWELRVTDNGKGMSAQTLKNALDPFYSEAGKHDHRKVGLGLPFLKQATEATDGFFEIESEQGKGTELQARFKSDHWDCPPLGDVISTLRLMMTWTGTFELDFQRKRLGASYEIARSDLIEALGDLSDVSSLQLMHQFLEGLELELME